MSTISPPDELLPVHLVTPLTTTPQYVAQREIALGLTVWQQELAQHWVDRAHFFRDAMADPNQCPDEWLDFAALLAGFSGKYWKPTWTPTQKRAMIKQSAQIWRDRAKPEILARLFTIFDLKARLKPTEGWILDVTTFPQSLNSSWRSQVILVDASYVEGTAQLAQVREIVGIWIPAWISFAIQRG